MAPDHREDHIRHAEHFHRREEATTRFARLQANLAAHPDIAALVCNLRVPTPEGIMAVVTAVGVGADDPRLLTGPCGTPIALDEQIWRILEDRHRQHHRRGVTWLEGHYAAAGGLGLSTRDPDG